MFVSQSIRSPLGVSSFGSSLIRVPADLALLNFSITRVQKLPAAAFQETRASAKSVREFLANANIEDVQASRITLSQKWNHSSYGRKPEGYSARSSFSVLLDDLEQLEPILCGVIDAGANEVGDVSFQSRQLKEHRAQARKQAAEQARQKAQVYASALGKGVGEVLHIEDVNPDQLRGNEGHVARDPGVGEEGTVKAFDPGSIAVGGAVLVVFALTDPTVL